MSDDRGTGCAEALEHLRQYLDGELPDGDLAVIGQHLAACDPCGDRAAFEAAFRDVLRRRCHEHAPADLVRRIRSRLADPTG